MEKIERARESDYPILIRIWEDSVRVTHDFLNEDDIVFYRKRILEEYFSAVELYVIRDDAGVVAGFMGIAGKKLEMLFVNPVHFRKQYGKRLAAYAIEKLGVAEVDVNEQNPFAALFYKKQGFRVVGRSETDGEGRQFPILHMRLKD